MFTLLISFGLFAQTDVLPPVLVSPTNEAVRQMPDVLFDWYASAGIGSISYELQYDTSSSFSNPVSIITEFTSANGLNLLFATTYYWRVRTMDDVGTSSWSEVFSFFTFEQIDLDDPGDGDDNITPEIDLEWKVKYSGKSITGITHYDYEVALDPDFNNIYLHGSKAYVATTAATQLHTIHLLLFDTTYYWHVRARHDADTTVWSDTWMFETTDQVVHTAPANGATGQMLNVTISWVDMPGVYEYIYELCNDPSFTTPCIFFTDDNTVTAMGLLFNTTYYWRVKAAHTADTSSWSQAWSFQTVSSVNLVSPANGSYVDDYFPLLTWQALTGINGFQLLYDVDQNFSNPTAELVDGTKNSFKMIFSLELDETYYWKVRAFENGDTTAWSPVWSFTVGQSPQGLGNLLTDETVSIYPNPAVNDLYLEVNALKQTEIELNILNLLGQAIVRERVTLEQGINKHAVSLPELEEGLYIVRINSGDENYMKKLVIKK